jgi:cold-inducible RNA-binding protein
MERIEDFTWRWVFDPEERVMGRRLYVGNLAWTVTDQDLQDVFSEAGPVDSSQVIMDRATNRSRGFGFVEMATDEAADIAIEKLNGRDIKGRPIRVNEAQARTGGGGRGPSRD